MTWARLQFILLVLFNRFTVLEPSPLRCGRGEYFKQGKNGEEDSCEKCNPGHYQGEASHRDQYCHKCTFYDESQSPVKILVGNCTRFHDIIVRCENGFYFSEYDKDCKRCRKCTLDGKHEGQLCTHNTSTVCCDTEGMKVKGGKCVAPEDYCGPGEFLVPGPECRTCEQCKPCGNVSKSEAGHSNRSQDQTGEDNANGGICMQTGWFVVMVIAIVSFIVGLIFPKIINFCKAMIFSKIINFRKAMWPKKPKGNEDYSEVRQEEIEVNSV